MKILIAYYSRTGFTRTLAQRIARACNADLEAIEDDSLCGSRSGPIGYVRSSLEAALHLKAGIRPARHAPAEYDLTLIGTPVWFWNLSSPVRSYIEQHRAEIRRVGFFCTCGSSGQIKVLKDMEQLSGKRAVAGLGLTDAEISGNHCKAKVDAFAARIGRSAGRRRARAGARPAAVS